MDHVSAGADWIAADEWISKAPRHDGSWWDAWSQWLHEQSTSTVAARAIDQQRIVADAPGEYVMVRYAD
jgi:polyhydroxyalkanoate synthase